MQLKVIGSSSKGNCYVLENETSALIIEVGVSFIELKKAINFNTRKIKGAIVSHRHNDHFGHAKEYLKSYIDIHCNKDVYDNYKGNNKGQLKVFENKKTFYIDEFKILPFDLKHDVECSGFLINHKDMGNLLFVTDTIYLPYTFKNLNHILIEANYDRGIFKDKIDFSENKFINKRTLSGHLDITTCIEALKSNDLSKVNEIVLIHLSDSNSNAVTFKSMIEREFGKVCYIADKGLEIDLY